MFVDFILLERLHKLLWEAGLIQGKREREIVSEKQRWRFYHNTMKDKSTSILFKGIRIAFILCRKGGMLLRNLQKTHFGLNKNKNHRECSKLRFKIIN